MLAISAAMPPIEMSTLEDARNRPGGKEQISYAMATVQLVPPVIHLLAWHRL